MPQAEADLRKSGGHGRPNGEQSHVARIKVAATALVDSGETSHIFSDEKLVTQKSYKVDTSIQTVTDEFVKPNCVGKCNLGLGLNTETVASNQVLFAPTFSSKLFSVSKLCDDG